MKSQIARVLPEAWGPEGDGTTQKNGDNLSKVTDTILSTASLMPFEVGNDLGEEADKWNGGVQCPEDRCIYGIPRNAHHVLCFDPATQSAGPISSDLGGKTCKWSGAVLGDDGCIYGIPSCANRVLRFDPKTKLCSQIGDDFGRKNKKWCGGAAADDGKIYCVPFNEKQVLCIDPTTDSTSLIGEVFLGNIMGKWSGAVKADNGCIYGIPYSASSVLRINPETGTCETVGNVLGRASEKWSGGVLAPDGSIYGIPQRALQVLRFNPRTEVATRIGEDLGDGLSKWDGGVLGADGCIYAFPKLAKRMLKIDPKSRTTALVGDRKSNNVGYDGGVAAVDGCIYAIPCSAARVLRYDPRTQAVSCFGDDLELTSQKYVGGEMAGEEYFYCIPNQADQVMCFNTQTGEAELIGNSYGEGGQKWHGCVQANDGRIFAIPRDHPRWLCIDPVDNSTTLVGNELPHGGGKWNGGVLGEDGRIYAIPRNHQQVIRFDPQNNNWALIGGAFGKMGDKWMGGVLGSDGCIYGIPSNSNQVLRIDPVSESTELVGPDLGDHVHKWAGGCMAQDGAMYFIPRDARQILRWDPASGTATLIGQDLGPTPDKWMGAVQGYDGCIYALPCAAKNVLYFDPRTFCTAMIGSELDGGSNKWAGGALHRQSGHIFGVPSSAPQVLRIFPDVAECAVLGCLRMLVGLETKFSSSTLRGMTVNDISGRPGTSEGGNLLKNVLRNPCHWKIIATQWNILCNIPCGSKTLAAHLKRAPNCIGDVLDTHSSVWSEYLAIPGVREFLKQPESIDSWLQERIVNVPERIDAIVAYFKLTSKLCRDDNGEQLLIQLAKQPKLLANMLKLPTQDIDRLISTDMVSSLIELKLQQPFAALAQALDCTFMCALVTTYMGATWPYADPDLKERRASFRRNCQIACLVIDIFMGIYELCQAIAMCRLGLFRIHILSRETLMDIAMIVLVVVVCAENLRSDFKSNQTEEVVEVITTFLLFNKLLDLLATLNTQIATFKTSLYLIILDCRPFVVVLLLYGTSFVHSFRLIQQAAKEPVEAFGPFGDSVWEVFGMLTGAFENGNYPSSTILSRPLFYVYMTVVFVVMMNVLIAVVSDSWAAAQAHAKTLFRRGQLQYSALFDALGLTKLRKLPKRAHRAAVSCRSYLNVSHSWADDEEDATAENLQQRILELEQQVKFSEGASLTKLEAKMEGMMAKMEVRIAARMQTGEAAASP